MKESWMWTKAGTNCDVWKYMKTMESARHSKACLSLTSFSLTVGGDLQEKWMSFSIMLHAYLV